MPFSGNTYTGPTGSTNAAAGQVVQSAVWNNIHTDLADALTSLRTQNNTQTPSWANLMAPNGGFNVWQRGTSFSVAASSTAYAADRWCLTTGANEASTVAAATGIDDAAGPNAACKVTRDAGQTGVTAMTFGYPLDSDEVSRMRGAYVSFECMAKAGADWSPASGTLTVELAVGTGSPAKRGAGFTGETILFSETADLTAGGSAATITATSAATVPTNASQGELQFIWTPVGTAGADDSVTLDGCCLVLGEIVQSFSEIPFEISLEMCKRHYRKSFPYGTAPAYAAGRTGALTAVSAAAARVAVYVAFSPELRDTPTVTTFSTDATASTWVDLTTSVSVTAYAFSSIVAASGVFIYTNNSVSAANHFLSIHYDADASI